MTTIQFRDWELTADVEATRALYARVEVKGVGNCLCAGCENFAAFRTEAYPDEVKRLLESLGVEWWKEAEVYHVYKHENGLHNYGGWLHFKGSYKFTGKKYGYTPITENFSISFTNGNDLTLLEDREGLVQVEFDTFIPWVIDPKLESA